MSVFGPIVPFKAAIRRGMISCGLLAVVFQGAFQPAFGQTAPVAATLGGLNPALLTNQATIGGGQTGNNSGLSGGGATSGNNNQSPVNPAQTVSNTAGAAPSLPAITVAPAVNGGLTTGGVARVPSVQQPLTRRLPVQGGGGSGVATNAAPFDPLGLRVGRFTFRPAVEVASGYSSNSTSDVTGSGSSFVSINPELAVESNFARHALAFQVRAGLDRFSSGDDTSDTEVIANASGRFDVNEETAITAAFGYAAQEDDLTGVSDDPLERTTTASLQLDHRLNGVDTRSQIRLSRNVNGEFTDAAGVRQDQDDLNSTLFGFNARATLARGGSIAPFIEGDIAREIFDESEDVLGNQRNVVGLRGLVGLEIDRGEKLAGEVAAGLGRNLVDGDGIDDFGAFLVAFNLNWSPRRLTTVTLNGTTVLDAFPSIATPGDTTYDFNLDIAHNFRENWTATAGTGLIFQVDGADLGTDTTIEARLGVEYQLNRNLGIGLAYDFQRQFTVDGLADFTANTISLGVRAER